MIECNLNSLHQQLVFPPFVWFRFMKPLLTHSTPPLTATLPACLLPLTKLLTTKEQRVGVSCLFTLLIADSSDWLMIDFA